MSRLTASGIDRAQKCGWAFRPDAGPANVGASASADAGTDEHANIEETIDEETERDAIGESIAASEGQTGESRPKSATHARWLEEWWPVERHLAWHSETSIAIDPLTGETRLGPSGLGWGHRDYAWAPDRMIPGTVDAWTIDGDTLRVVDWKCGQASHIGDPAKSGQLRLLALALARHHGHRGPVSLEYVKINESRLWVEKARVTRVDLLSFQAELAALVARLPDSAPAPGHWCSSLWCPYLGRCPVTVGAVAALRGGLPDDPFRVVLPGGRFESDEHATWQYRVLRAADKALEEAWRALKDRARARPVPLGEGVTYAETEKTRETIQIDAAGAEAALRSSLPEVALSEIVEVKRKLTKARLDDAARYAAERRSAATGKRVTIKAVVAQAMLALRQVGAVKVSPYRELAEVKAKETRDE